MNRRGFLGVLAAAVAGTAFDPERALWVPGRKLISIPKEFHCPIAFNPQFSVEFEFSDPLYSATMQEFHDRYLVPAAEAAMREMEEYVLWGLPYPPGFLKDLEVLQR